MERQYYHSVDPFVTTRQKRRDTDWIFGLTYGIPFADALRLADKTFADKPTVLPDGWGDILLSIGTNLTVSDSNIPNYDYNNWRFQALMTKSWAF